MSIKWHLNIGKIHILTQVGTLIHVDRELYKRKAHQIRSTAVNSNTQGTKNFVRVSECSNY